jgi:hypothetical protein
MATKKKLPIAAAPHDSVGIQVPAGHIRANRTHWQIILHAPKKPMIYRLFNAAPARAGQAANNMIVEVDHGEHPLHVAPGSSIDVMGGRIRVKAGTGSATHIVAGWYVLIS